MPDPILVIDLPDETATAALAERVAAIIAVGDTIALHGDLGAGKTTFARALIRSLAADPALEVPSPTFTLVQTYDTPGLAVSHIDLYRITRPDEIEETGLLEAASEGAALIEWPERAGGLLPMDRLDIRLEVVGPARRARLSGTAAWAARLQGPPTGA